MSNAINTNPPMSVVRRTYYVALTRAETKTLLDFDALTINHDRFFSFAQYVEWNGHFGPGMWFTCDVEDTEKAKAEIRAFLSAVPDLMADAALAQAA